MNCRNVKELTYTKKPCPFQNAVYVIGCQVIVQDLGRCPIYSPSKKCLLRCAIIVELLLGYINIR